MKTGKSQQVKLIDGNIILTLLQETKYGTQIYLFREKNIEYAYTSSFK